MRATALAAILSVHAHGLAQPAPPQTLTLASVLEPLFATPRLPGARFGVVVMDAASGQVLFQHEPDLALNPASNTKILTAAAALSLLGPERRFVTALHANVRAGVAREIVLAGRGDPSLRTADLLDLARQAYAAGLRRVEEDVLVDDTYFGSEHLPPAFEQHPREVAAYRAAVGAASIDGNALTVRVRPGVVGGPAHVACDPPGYCLLAAEVTTLAGESNRVNLEAQSIRDGRERLRVTGNVSPTAPAIVSTRRLEHPAFAAGWALRSALETVGVRVHGAVRVSAAPGDLEPIARHHSPPLSALLYEVGKDSNNFYAEMVLLAIAAGAEGNGAASFTRGAERVVAWARNAGIPVEGLVVRNGSGLYDANRMSARQLAEVLRAAWRDPAIRNEFVAQLAVAGVDGTLRSRLREVGVGRVVRAKTGTLDDVVALSGFVLTGDPGRALVFSVLANGVHGHGPEARALIDQIVLRLVRSSQGPSVAAIP
jgi:D-alanyl-D-alanine carboxypeptidase/D-alanyl-D-alanine-endopeptidase (penicillin-binding protein 4)